MRFDKALVSVALVLAGVSAMQEGNLKLAGACFCLALVIW